ncbi:MAG: tRNA adenosine(34) deaminase TadA [Endomicrobium sp.]|jgi:tRNA(adenine34) deaminase|nr:tRNA adenosine(34) deaminase TadA [Endomicrobium sp.]
MILKDNIYFMQKAIAAAKKAEKNGEVPVGAVIVKNGKIAAEGFNRCITDSDPTAHAEIVALRKAAKKLNNYRLNGCNIYVTIEPCSMCAGALVNARIEKIYFGAFDKKAGACKSVFKIAGSKKLNHKIEFHGGILKKECADIIQKFFKNKR